MDNEAPASDDYDTPWKDAITRYFPDVLLACSFAHSSPIHSISLIVR